MMVSETDSIEDIKRGFPDILYKYRVWSEPYHKTIISKQEVFFAAPDSFPDKNDCRFPIDWDFSFKNMKPVLEENFPKGRNSNHQQDHESDVNELYLKLYNELFGDKKKQDQLIKDYYATLIYHLGVLSLTARNNNMEIWKSRCYALNFSGFCVGIDFKMCLQMLRNNNIGGAAVKYVPHDHPKLKYVDINTHSFNDVLNFYMKNITTKYIDFEFEEEYRLVKYSFASRNSQNYWDTLSADDRKVIIPKECFKSVIFGYKMLESEIEEIVQGCNQQGLNVDFFKASVTNEDTVELESLNFIDG